MKITAIEIRPYAVPLRVPLHTARGTIDRRAGAFVVARADDGRTGLGEIAPLPPFSRETPNEATGAAREMAPRLRGVTIAATADLEDLHERLERAAQGRAIPASTAFGLETALADLAARVADRPLARWLNPESAARVPVNALLPGRNREIGREAAALDEIRRRGYRTVKIKVGAHPVEATEDSIEADAARVEAIRGALGAGVAIRLDANRAWSFDAATRAMRRFAPLGVEYVEEPLVKADLERLPTLFEMTGVPIAIDETVRSPGALERLLDSGAVTALILKPSLAGGLLASRRLARRAEAAGVRAVITTLLETAAGTAACLHLAAALGPAVPACGLDTLRHIFGASVPGAFEVRDGTLGLPSGPGLGFPDRSLVPGGIGSEPGRPAAAGGVER